MSERWLRLYEGVVNDPKLQRLSGEEFRRQFYAAIAGEQSLFAPFVRVDDGRRRGSVWATIRAAIFARDDFTCQYCGERGGRLECDHIVPVSRGGEDHESNLATACRPCNRSKRDKLLEEWFP